MSHQGSTLRNYIHQDIHKQLLANKDLEIRELKKLLTDLQPTIFYTHMKISEDIVNGVYINDDTATLSAEHMKNKTAQYLKEIREKTL